MKNVLYQKRKNKKLIYAAANNPVWIIRDKEFIALEADRMPIGKHDKDSIPFTQHEVELKKGDTVYTFTGNGSVTF